MAEHLTFQSKDGGSIPASKLHFHLGQVDEARILVKQYHYSHRYPSSICEVGTFHLDGGLFGNMGVAVAACCFGIPPTRWREPVLELQRLVRKPHYKTELSQLISLTVRYIRRYTTHDLLVSFADKSHKHEGYVYRACCWHYGGLRERRMDGVIIDGEFWPGRSCNNKWGTQSPKRLAALLNRKIIPYMDGVIVGGTFHPGRSCNSRWGTRSPKRLAEMLNKTVMPHYDEGKHLYWKALHKSGEQKAKRLRLQTIDWKR